MTWTETMELFATKFFENKSEAIELFFYNKNLIQIFGEILLLNIKAGKQSPTCAISQTGLLIIDDHLNELKKRVLNISKIMIFHSIHKKNSVYNYKNSIFIETIKQILPYFIDSFLAVIHDKESHFRQHNVTKLL